MSIKCYMVNSSERCGNFPINIVTSVLKNNAVYNFDNEGFTSSETLTN